MSTSILATRPCIAPNLKRRMVQKECEVFEASGRQPANSSLSMNLCLLFSPLLWKQKEHLVHVDFLLQNSSLVYMILQSTHCAL